jgi:2-(1,2-epoxy-1,2-dihydrophenyl)acetyl-CoA isomerase
MPITGRLTGYTIGSTPRGRREALEIGPPCAGRVRKRKLMSDSQTQLETVNFSVAEGVATIELNRPDSLNAWNTQFGDDLLAAVARCREDEAVRSVLLTGAGRGFSSGADLRELGGGAATREQAPDAVYRQLTEVYHPIMTGLRELPKPVVAAVNGPAVGIGCSLALCCDLILAAESAYFLLAFVNIGLVPDGGSSVWLPTRIGLARASELCMLGERLPASQALEWGLINRVVPDGELLEVAGALAAKLAAGPTLSYAGTKRQLNNWLYERMGEQLDLEAQIQRDMVGSADSLEGAVAFMEKRPPHFTGR